MIAVAIGVVALLVYLYVDTNSATKRVTFNGVFYGLLIGVMIWFFIDAGFWFLYSGEKMTRTERTTVVSTTNIVALQDTNSTSGRFFLGSGSVGQKSYYAYCYETEYGYRYDKINVNGNIPVYIKYIESENEVPRIEQYAVKCSDYRTDYDPLPWSLITTWIYAGKSEGDLISERVHKQFEDGCRYVIYIPEGSIKQDYEIDLN